MQKIAVLIPCLNEATTIAKVVNDFRSRIPEAEIYVYDNASDDDTAGEAHKAGAIVRTIPLRGKGNVIRRMFNDIDADIYILVDGDDTYPADAVDALISPIACDGYDMVIGDRLRGNYFTENDRPLHNTGNRLVRSMINRIFHADIHDIMTGYRALSRDFVKNFPILSRGFEIETEMTVHALSTDALICEVPVTYRNRPEGSRSKLNTIKDGSRILGTILALFRDYRPLQFFGLLALAAIITGVAFLIPVFIEYIHTGLVPRFPTLIAGSFAILFGALLYFIGLILHIIQRKYLMLYRLLEKRDRL